MAAPRQFGSATPPSELGGGACGRRRVVETSRSIPTRTRTRRDNHRPFGAPLHDVEDAHAASPAGTTELRPGTANPERSRDDSSWSQSPRHRGRAPTDTHSPRDAARGVRVDRTAPLPRRVACRSLGACLAVLRLVFAIRGSLAALKPLAQLGFPVLDCAMRRTRSSDAAVSPFAQPGLTPLEPGCLGEDRGMCTRRTVRGIVSMELWSRCRRRDSNPHRACAQADLKSAA